MPWRRSPHQRQRDYRRVCPPCARMQSAAAPGCRGRAPRRDGRALRAGGVANPHTDVQRVSSWPMEPRMELREITDLSPAAHVSLRVVHTGHKHAFNTTRARALGILHPDRPSTGAAIAWTEAWAGTTVSRCSERRSRRIPVQESSERLCPLAGRGVPSTAPDACIHWRPCPLAGGPEHRPTPSASVLVLSRDVAPGGVPHAGRGTRREGSRWTVTLLRHCCGARAGIVLSTRSFRYMA